MVTYCKLSAWARQVSEQVRGSRQTGWSHISVGRVRELVKTPNGLQAALSIRASEEADQQMYTVLVPERKHSFTHKDEEVT